MREKELLAVIEAIGRVPIEGNVIPASWYQHLRYPSGRPYHIAITLLGEIVYWFRPSERERGGRKKFHGDGLQRSYAAWGAPFGFSRRECADALKYLAAEGFITTELRNFGKADGTKMVNALFITGVNPERLQAITHHRRPPTDRPVPHAEVLPADGSPVPTGEVMPADAAGSSASTQEGLPQDEGGCYAENGEGDTPDRLHIENKENTEITETPESGGAGDVQMGLRGERLSYPAILVQPASRRGVLQLGQRAMRDDLAYPNVAAAHLWAMRTLNTPLVLEPPEETAELHNALSLLEGRLAEFRERRLRERSLTFGQALGELADSLAQSLTTPDRITALSELVKAVLSFSQ